MKTDSPLPEDKKLTIVFRVEPGCLGPHGKDDIDAFCRFAQKEFESSAPMMVKYSVVPRNDKTLPEAEFRIGGRKLSDEKAGKYLDVFNKNLDQILEQLNDQLSDLIDQFLGR